MWMSNIYVVVDRRNADRNSLEDITQAISSAGATIVSLDERCHVIEAAIPTSEIPVVRAMDGVSYVRTIFNYFSEEQPVPPKAA